MLTIFATPKPFHGHVGTNQRNAIQSWLQLRPSCEIILFGDGDGTAQVAGELGVRHMPEIDCNEYGTPLLNALFETAQRMASHPTLCYVNADIMLMSDFMQAVQQVGRRSFLLTGQRTDVDLHEPWDFTYPEWEDRLRTYVDQAGSLHSVAGMDYFVFPRGLYRDLPPFAIGRKYWDNWLVYQARALGAAVVDATAVVTAVHQNHDFSHHPQGEKGVREGPEAVRNRELAGSLSKGFTVQDATWLLTPKGLRRAVTWAHLSRRLERGLLPALRPVTRPVRRALGLAKRAIA